MYLWLILNLADLVLTLLIVRNGGIEVMPINSWLYSIGEWLFFAVKIGGTLLVYFFFNWFWNEKYPSTIRVLNGAFLAVVGINAVSLYIVI